jgi:nucleoside-diphosphate-sugar epimerase
MAVPKIIVTGATGFVGQAVVRAAREHGYKVHALSRSKKHCPKSWAKDTSIVFSELDLSDPEAVSTLGATLKECDAVIHAAATMSGNDALHQQDTVDPTRYLIQELCKLEKPPRFILVSSLSVYGYSAMPDWSTLDETTPVEIDSNHRDAYCRSKLTQEALVINAVQSQGLTARIIRPGAIYDPNRKCTSRLGFSKGSRIICIGGDAPIPAIHVDHCAEVLVRAAIKNLSIYDIPIPLGTGQLEIINAVDPNAPTQKEWISACKLSVFYLPRRPLKLLIRFLTLAADLVPGIFKKLPTLFHEATFSARFKPLHYSTARLEDRLEYSPELSFLEAITPEK